MPFGINLMRSQVACRAAQGRFDMHRMLKQLTVWLLKGYASSYLACCGLNFC